MWTGRKGVCPDRVSVSLYREEVLCRTETVLAFHCTVEALCFVPTLGAVVVVGYHRSEVVTGYLVDVSGWEFQEEGEIVLEADLFQGLYMYG